MNDLSVPLSYRSYRQIQQLSNVGNLESKNSLEKSNDNSPIQVNNSLRSDVDEIDINNKQGNKA